MSSPGPWGDAKARIQAAAVVPDLMTSWPNLAFQKPAPEPGVAWVAIEMTSTVLEPIELAGGVWEETGILWVHLFVPWGTGSEYARQLSKDFANVFRSLAPAPTTYLRASFGDGGRDDVDGNWWRMTTSIEWQYQDITV